MTGPRRLKPRLSTWNPASGGKKQSTKVDLAPFKRRLQSVAEVTVHKYAQ